MMEKGKSIYKLPEGWEWSTINEIIDAQEGFFKDGDWVESKDQDTNGQIRLIQLADIGDGEFRNRSNRFMNEERADVLGCTYLKKGDILLARMPDPLGRACIFPYIEENKYVTVVDVAILRTGKNGVNSKFLMYLINSPIVRKEIDSLKSGSTRIRISRNNLSKIQFPIPPLKEQLRIITKLDELYSEIEHAEKALKKAKHQLEIYSQSLLKNAFNGKLTEKWRIDDSSNMLKGSQNKNGVLPIGWKCIEIEKFAEFVGSGSTPKGGRNVYQENGIPFIRSQNIHPNYLVQDDLVFISKDVNEKMKRTQIKPKDVLLNITGASIGRCAFIPENFEKGNVNQHVCIIRVLPKYINYRYLTYFLNSPESQLNIQKINSGATREALNLSQIKNISVPICSIEEQQQIVFHLDSRSTICKNLEESISKELFNLEKVKCTILNDAYRGKLVHQDLSEDSASTFLVQIKKEKNLYFKKIKTQKMKTSSNYKSDKKKKELIELIIEKYANTEFSFEEIRRLSDKPYEDLKAELYLLLDKNKELEIVFNKSNKKIFYIIKS